MESTPSADNAGANAAASVEARIGELVASDRVLLFMKGTRDMPQCGFSARVVDILDRLIPEYHTVDVLSDPEIREGIKAFSDWPTIPQLYVKGEFQGGCDIVTEMYEAGELHELLEVERGDGTVTGIEISEPVLAMLREANEQQPGELHLSVDARYRHSLHFAPVAEGDVGLEFDGLKLFVDRDSAPRATGIKILMDEGGNRLRIDNPNA